MRIWQKLPITILFVTHDVDEAVFLSTRIISLGKRRRRDRRGRHDRPAVAARPDRDPRPSRNSPICGRSCSQASSSRKRAPRRRKPRRGSEMARRWPGFLLIVVLLLLWEVASAQNWIDPVSMPQGEHDCALVGGEHRRRATAAKSSGRRCGGSVSVSVWRSLVAVPLGLLMGSIPFVYRLFEPITEFIRPIPELGLHSGRHPVSRHRQRDEDLRGLPRLPVPDPAEHL